MGLVRGWHCGACLRAVLVAARAPRSWPPDDVCGCPQQLGYFADEGVTVVRVELREQRPHGDGGGVVCGEHDGAEFVDVGVADLPLLGPTGAGPGVAAVRDLEPERHALD